MKREEKGPMSAYALPVTTSFYPHLPHLIERATSTNGRRAMMMPMVMVTIGHKPCQKKVRNKSCIRDCLRYYPNPITPHAIASTHPKMK